MKNTESGQKNRNMQAVKNKDSKIELMLRHELWSRGVRYRKNVSWIFGKPDIAFIGKKVAVFCDSEFWHGFDWERQKEKIKTNRELWIHKIERNIARDKEVTEKLEAGGWIVLRFWGNEISKNVGSVRMSLLMCLRREGDATKNNRPMCRHRRHSSRI